MANDMLLRDAVRAVKLKIQAAAADATPEELAYLGTAIDRIGGRATLLEVEELGDIKGREIADAASQMLEQALGSLASANQEAIAEFTNVTSQAKETAVAAVTEAAQGLTDAAAIAMQQALNGSMFINHFYASIR